jgi:hypothetical protein
MCGDDGCGSECGTCQGLAQCLQGFCVCQPTCYYKLCGSDGCGGSCGECPAESSCENGACIDLDGNCSDGNSLDWDGCTSSSVAEFRVNDNLEQDQASPAVVSIPAGDPLLGDGGFAIAWDGNGLADTNGIYIRIFDQSGVPITTGKLVNESISNAQSDATLAKLADSSLMLVAWNSYTGVDNSFEVMGRVLDLSGAPHADEFVINQHSSGAQETPAVTGLNNGNLAAAWSGAGAGDDSGIYLRVFKPDGSALTDDIQVNEWPSGTQAEADLATLADGNIVVTWTSEGNDNDKNGIAMRMFAPDGSPLDAESPVDITQANSQDRPAITALGGGGFIIAWDSIVAINFREVVAQRYGGPPDYGMEGGEIAINKHVANAQSASDVAPHVGDGYVVFWESLSQDGDTGSGIFGNWFLDTNQHIFNDDQHANSYVDGIQQSVAIAAGQDDTLIVVWQSETTDSDIDVFAQRYKSDGARMYR